MKKKKKKKKRKIWRDTEPDHWSVIAISGNNTHFVDCIHRCHRMILTLVMSPSAVPIKHVSRTTVNVYTTNNSMQKMWIFTILKLFSTSNTRCEAIPNSSWQTGTVTVKLCAIKWKVNSPLKITKLIDMVFSGWSLCCYNGLKFKYLEFTQCMMDWT